MDYILNSLQSHSYLLSCFIRSELNLKASKRHISGGSIVSSNMASEWLEIASAVKHVEVDMCEHDDTLAYCGTAYDFQEERGGLMSDLFKSLTIFNLIWNSFEIMCKCIDLPKIPKEIKSGRHSFVDLAQYFIYKGNSNSVEKNIIFYEDILSKLIVKLKKVEEYDFQHKFDVNPYTNKAGIGIQIVKVIRNLFAHGAINPPEHEDYSSDSFIDSTIIDFSSRIVLMTLQMLLLSEKYAPYDPKLGLLEKNHPFWDGVDWGYLHVLHIKNS